MGTFLAVVFAAVIGFVASPIVIYFILKNNVKLSAWVVAKLVK